MSTVLSDNNRNTAFTISMIYTTDDIPLQADSEGRHLL